MVRGPGVGLLGCGVEVRATLRAEYNHSVGTDLVCERASPVLGSTNLAGVVRAAETVAAATLS